MVQISTIEVGKVRGVNAKILVSMFKPNLEYMFTFGVIVFEAMDITTLAAITDHMHFVPHLMQFVDASVTLKHTFVDAHQGNAFPYL